jgi:site-specific recombinase XerC
MKMEKYLTEDEEKKLFATVGNVKGVYAERDWAWMWLLRHTGMRIGSLAGLTIADARKALIHGRLTLKGEHAKRGNGYEVPINKKAKSALRLLIKCCEQMGYTTQPNQPLVMGRNHKGLSIRSFQDRMRFWSDLSGLDMKITPHWFRHTLAIRIMDRSTANDPRAMAQAALGHKAANSTLIYTRPRKEDVAMAMEEAS